MSAMFTPSLAECQSHLRDDTGAVGDRHAQLVNLASGHVYLEQPPPVIAGCVVPFRYGLRLARAQRRGRLAQALDRQIDLIRDRASRLVR